MCTAVPTETTAHCTAQEIGLTLPVMPLPTPICARPGKPAMKSAP
nr:MAG TPA: hypothetical protein [Caudoviricetes sp.]